MSESKPMRLAVSGANGMIGEALCAWAEAKGYEVVRLVRTPRKPNDIEWHAEASNQDYSWLERVACIVHLAGAPIAEKRWSAKVKESIYRSRVQGTKSITAALMRLTHKPAFVVSSAIGFYGDTSAVEAPGVTETHPAGESFLAKVCVDWEAAAKPAESAGCRVSYIRTGVVLSTSGGALAKMLPVFRLGLGGALGSGKQRMSCITLEDLVRVYAYAIESSVQGPLNAVMPEPVRNKTFTRILAQKLNRPALLPVPAFALKLVLGEMADALLLSDSAVLPHRLQESGFEFKHDTLEQALSAILALPE